MSYTEESYENVVLAVLRDTLGYDHVYGPDFERDYSNPLYEPDLLPSLRRINSNVPEEALVEAIHKLRNLGDGTLLQRNTVFMDYLQNGVSVNYFDGVEQRSALVQLVDYKNTDNNNFVAINQWTVEEYNTKRPDVVIFLNGLPIAVFELKSPSREDTDASEAYIQLRNYMTNDIPSLFAYNAFCVISDLAISKAGTITAGEDRFMEWKTKDGGYENTQYADYKTFFEGMFDKARFLDIIKNFICFSGDVKILAAYHQYFAVRKAVESTQSATETDGKGGVFWHTQGSGKSLSMVFYARLLQEAVSSPTIVVLTDRNDLDDQLFKQFAKCADFLRQTPERARSREHLKELLNSRQANGIIFTTAQKFEESEDCLSDRRNLIIMADEAHRSQFISESADKEGRIKKSFGLIIRENLPHATFIGFTGTPISSKDRSTVEVFGDYIDIYDMTQAVEDDATKPVYYESRVIHLKLDEDILKRIDAEYDLMAQEAEHYAIEKSKKELGRLDSILGADQTLDALCRDIIEHYEENRATELTGKAMIVAYSRTIAMKIYQRILEMRPEWSEKANVVMTSGNKDPEEWRKVIGNKTYRDEMATRFKNNDDPFKIAIVVDMWLTGFDIPSLATMYVYKPMAGHNLMQAIARVNRVYKDKAGGLVVDYVGIAGALKQAMNDYTNRDKHNYGDTDIAKTALPKFVEKLEVCRDLMYGYDYSAFMDDSASDLDRADAIRGGVNHIATITVPLLLYPEIRFLDESNSEGMKSHKDAFIKEAALLRQALSLCRSLLTAEQRHEAAYFEVVRTLLTRVTSENKPLSLKEINGCINELLKASIKNEGVINLFSDEGIEFSLFDARFLEEISKMKERNLAVEVLKKLLAEQITTYRKTNLVKSEKFSEMLSRAMKAYISGMLSNEKVIAELMKIAEEIKAAQEEGESLGLSNEELAFYDAITRPAAIKDFYENDVLIAMTRELTEVLKKNRTIDWYRRESARAGMRMEVKRLLKKYDYPPEGVEDAVATVIGQCEMWADN